MDQLQETKTMPIFTELKQAVIYARVSTDEQADMGTSLDSQKEAIEVYAKANDIKIVAYFDDDYTGRRLDRPGFTRVRKYLQDGLANVLIVYRPDRLSRHRTHTMMIVDELQGLGCELHTVDKGKIDLEDDTAVLMLSIEGHISHREVNDIVERCTRGRREKARKGQIMGAVAPYGYRMERDTEETKHGRVIVTNRYLEIEPQEAQIVKLIFELFVHKDYSYRGIAHYLDKHKGRYRTGKRWGSHYVYQIIRKTVYKGDYTYKNIVVPVPPIITAELWESAQEKREHNRKRKRHSNRGRYIFTGRVKCYHCGYHMVGSQQNDGYYYRCNCAYSYNVDYFARTGKKCENYHKFHTHKVEDTVFNWLHKVMTNEKTLKLGLKNYVDDQTRKYKPMLDDLSRVERLLTRKLGARDKLIDAYLDDIFDRETIKARQIQVEQEIKSAKSTKAELEQQLEKILDLPNQVKTIEDLGAIAHKAFKTGIPQEKRKELIEALDIQIKLEQAEDGYYVHVTSVVGSMLLTLSSKDKDAGLV